MMGEIKTIMVIDDEPKVLTEVRKLLEADQYDVITAATSRQALEFFADSGEKKVDLILIDTPMPGTEKTALFSMKPKSKMQTTTSLENFLQKPFTVEQLRDFIKNKKRN